MKVYRVVGLLMIKIWMIHVFCSRTFSQFRICRVLLEDIAASTRGRCHVFLNDKELTVQFRGGFGGCVNGTRLFQHSCLPISSNATFLTDGLKSGDDVGSEYIWEFHRLPNVLGKRGGMSTFSVGLLEGSQVHM